MHTIHPLYTQCHMTLTLIMWELIFLTNSLCSTSRKYTFCILVPVWIVCTIVVCCVLGLSSTTHEENTYLSLTDIALLAEFMCELSVCCDAIIMKQNVLLCLLVSFWHLCHKLKVYNVHYSLYKVFLCDYIVLNLNFLVM